MQKWKMRAVAFTLAALLGSGVSTGWAGAGGNGNGKGGGNSSGAGNQGQKASAMGALNASHASANAFAHASPNSRVGRIAAYKAANEIAAATDADALGTGFTGALGLSTDVIAQQAYADWQAGTITQADFEAALAASTDTALQTAYADWQAALADDAAANTALEAAANKPVTPEVKAALDAELAAK